MPTRFERSSGVLLHPTSLPGGHGVGDLGPDAYRFVDWLASAGQRLWQILPLNPPGPFYSPYASPSAFAGNPFLLSLDALQEDGLVTSDEIAAFPRSSTGAINFVPMVREKSAVLRRAVRRFANAPSNELNRELEAFRTEHTWVEDYALFEALQAQYKGTAWQHWDADLARRQPSGLERARRELRDALDFHVITQFWFFRQWHALRSYANEHGVRIVGDIPIFVAASGTDVWVNQHLFWLDETGNPTLVAGVPPDYFSRTGQRWGNPLYRWEAMRAEGYAWWVGRLRATFNLVDIGRIDHFRGLASYWEIPAHHRTAEGGRWVTGPGMDFFNAVRAALGDVPIIVEDLGEITPDVPALRDALGYPGMRVLQYAFDTGPDNAFLPHNFERNTVVYTGTHDNDTTVGWFHSRSPTEQDHARRYLGVDGHDIAWDLIRVALSSVADLAIIPVQDVLSLGSEARMNLPGRPDGNWRWRLVDGELTALHADRLGQLARLYGRVA